MRRLLAAAAVLLAGHVILAALFWALLSLPESNVAMLGASALLLVVLVAGAAILQAEAVLRLATALPWRARAWRALAGPLPLLAALAVWLLVSWTVGLAEGGYESRRGEIDAWFIARFDWTSTAWLHTTVGWTLCAVRYVAGTSLGVAVLAAGVLDRTAALARPRALLAALAPRRLLTIGAIVTALLWLPWLGAWWRPAFQPVGAIEPALAAAKLAALAAIAHVGWALILLVAAQGHAGQRVSGEAPPAPKPPPA